MKPLRRVVRPARLDEEPIVDTYGELVTRTRVRARGCRCDVPCLTFRCGSRHHRGKRATPWCCGGSDYRLQRKGLVVYDWGRYELEALHRKLGEEGARGYYATLAGLEHAKQNEGAKP